MNASVFGVKIDVDLIWKSVKTNSQLSNEFYIQMHQRVSRWLWNDSRNFPSSDMSSCKRSRHCFNVKNALELKNERAVTIMKCNCKKNKNLAEPNLIWKGYNLFISSRIKSSTHWDYDKIRFELVSSWPNFCSWRKMNRERPTSSICALQKEQHREFIHKTFYRTAFEKTIQLENVR